MTELPKMAEHGQTAMPNVLVVGVIFAVLTDAIAGTALSLGRFDLIGDTHATPDEFAWLDIGYTASKLTGFMVTPMLINRIETRTLIVGATLVMGIACSIAAAVTRLDILVALRLVQGLSGGCLLVAGQTLVFMAFPGHRQPILQALFATGAVVAPATLTPALQGWLLDTRSWTWVFLSIAPFSLAGAGALLIADCPSLPRGARRPASLTGILLASAALCCFTYVLSLGNRWDWQEAPHIVWLACAGTVMLLAFVGHQMYSGRQGLLDVTLFRPDDFCFAFIVSFVAGAALYGSAYLIPLFSVSVLAFTLTDAGLLLLPSGALFILSLFVVAWLIQYRRVPPFAAVPFGILMVMVAMWMLSGSNGESGIDDMLVAVLLRGAGLGFLFLSITMIAFSKLDYCRLATAIGLFNTGRQLGGLAGVAALQTLIDHDRAGNIAVLGANITNGTVAVDERFATIEAMLVAKGMNALEAGDAAAALLARTLFGQAHVIAIDTAFNAVAFLFLFAAPLLVAVKIAFARYAKLRTEQGT